MRGSEGFDDVVLSQLQRVRAIGRGMLPRSTDIDDFVHDVIARVYIHRDQVRDHSRLPQWIAAIARNTARTWRRNDSRPPAPLPVTADPTPAEHAEAQERWQAVVEALNALRPEDRELLTAHYIEQQGYDELRTRFGHSYTAISSRLHRARLRMRRMLGATIGGAIALACSLPRRALAARPTSTAFTVAFLAHAALVVGGLLVLARGVESVLRGPTERRATGHPAAVRCRGGSANPRCECGAGWNNRSWPERRRLRTARRRRVSERGRLPLRRTRRGWTHD
ncbi:MAG: sigma-70 family RNA polymerase sigma factor [Candidatus Poribacteria bacterium]